MKKSSSGCNLYSGLTKKAPAPVDSSMKIHSGSTVNSEPTRSSTAPTPRTIDGRVA